MLSDKNIASVSNALANIDKASFDAAADTLRSEAAGRRAARCRERSEGSGQQANQVVGTAGPEVVTALNRVRTVAENLANASENLNKLVDENRQDIRSFTREGLPELERFLREGRSAAREFRDLSRSLREDPSQILYQPPQQGVTIPR